MVKFFRTVAILRFIPLCLLKGLAKEILKSMFIGEDSISKQLRVWEDVYLGRKVYKCDEKGWLFRGMVGTVR